MPLIFKNLQPPPVVLGNRRRHFDRAVRALAPTIAELRSAGIVAVGELAQCLNDKGLLACDHGCDFVGHGVGSVNFTAFFLGGTTGSDRASRSN